MTIDIVVLTGSVRDGNFTAKAAALVMDELAKHDDVRATLVDAREQVLALPGRSVEGDTGAALRETVSNATGVVFATPEYHGSMSSVSKLLIDNLGFPSVLAGKPVALLGVAAGAIGAIKALEHLRSVLSHVGAIVLPGPVSVAGVQRVFDADGNCLDEGTETRVRGVATGLLAFVHDHVCPKRALEAQARDAQ